MLLKMKYLSILIFFLLFSSPFITAQNLKKANYLFEKRAYLDAAELYSNETEKTQEILEKLGDCYYYNSKMIEAVNWYKQLINNYQNTTNPSYFFKYSQALKGINNFTEADKWHQKYNSSKNKQTDTLTTNDFIKKLALNTVEKYTIQKIGINSSSSDFGPSYYGDKLVFASNRDEGPNYNWNNLPYLDLYQVPIDSLNTTAKVVSFSKQINTKFHEATAVFTKDGKTMYFTRNNFLAGKKGTDENNVSHLKIYKATLINNQWTNIVELPFNSNFYSIEHPALNANETQLFFASDMPGTIGSFDIFVVDILDNNTFSIPKNLGPKINTEHREQFPFLDEENNLYFASDGHFGLGGLDIFKSKIVDENFSTPQNLGEPINSNFDDFSLIINQNNATGFFASNRLNGEGNDDIYKFNYQHSYFVNGIVQNKNSLALLPGAQVILMDTLNNIIHQTIVNETASFSFEIFPNNNYILKGSLKLFNPVTVAFSTDFKGNINKDILLQLESYNDAEKNIVVDNGKTQIKINPIYFDFDQWNIRADAAIELNNIVHIMKKYPAMMIEIGAHTDCRGSDQYNLKLSHKRANAVKEYLVSNGILEKNITSVGYGESQPLNNCTKPGMCKKEAYDMNRRCEFVILN